MKNKKNGFTYIECIISLSIILIATSLICNVLYESYNTANKNMEYRLIVNQGKSILEDKKQEILNNDYKEEVNNYSKDIREGYTVYTNVEKNEDYYQCYKINVKVKSKTKDIEFISYVTKQ